MKICPDAKRCSDETCVHRKPHRFLPDVGGAPRCGGMTDYCPACVDIRRKRAKKGGRK